MKKGPKKLIALLALLGFIALGFFGLSVHGGMPGEMNAGCPFMPGGYALCATNVLEHISAWKEAGTGLVSKIFALVLFGLAVSFLVVLNKKITVPENILLFRRMRWKNKLVDKNFFIRFLSWLSKLENSPSFS